MYSSDHLNKVGPAITRYKLIKDQKIDVLGAQIFNRTIARNCHRSEDSNVPKLPPA